MIDSRTLAKTALTLATRPDSDAAIKGFITYLKDHNLIGLLPQVLRHLEREIDTLSQEDTLDVYARYPLSKTLINQLKTIAGAEEATVIEHQDPSLVGGFRATYQGHIYDGSVKTQLERLRTKLTS